MSAQARVETRATWNDVDLQAGVRGTENKLQAFQGRVTRLFRRTPERRAETAIAGFIGDLSSGNVGGAISGLAGRISGFGLVAGIAIGAGVEAFIKFRQQAIDSDTAIAKLGETIGTFSNKGRSVEALGAHFRQVSADVKDALEKSSTVGNRITQFFRQDPLVGSPRTAGRQESQARAGIEDEINTLKRIGEAELKNAGVRDTALNVSERQGEIDKISLDAAEKRGAIVDEQRKALSDIARLSEKKLLPEGRAVKLIQAVNESARNRLAGVGKEEGLSIDQVEKKFELKKAEADMEERILNLIGNGKTLEENKTEAIRERLSFLKQAANLETTPEGQQAARLKIRGTENELFRTEFQNRNAPGSALYTPERGEEARFQNWLKNRSQFGERQRTLDMSGNEIPNPAYTRSPYAYDVAPQKGLMETGSTYLRTAKTDEGALRPITKSEMEAIMQKFWGGN